MKYLSLFFLLALAACPIPAVAKPVPVMAHLQVASDTAKLTIGQCQVPAGTVTCSATVTVTLDGVAQTVPAIATVAAGAPFAVLNIPLVCVPLKVVTASVTLFGHNASGTVSSGTALTPVSATCADVAPSNPLPQTLQLIIKPGGGF